jgi:hypothetical protein
MRLELPLRRWLFNVAAATSLVVFVTGVVLWAKTYWLADQIMWREVIAGYSRCRL